MRIAIVNEHRNEGLRGAELREKLPSIVRALSLQVTEAAKLWDRGPCPVELVSSVSKARGASVIAIHTDADMADALGYHDQTPDGRPYGKVFVRPILESGGTVSDSANSVSVTLSHEVLELWGDPNCNAWFDDAEGVSFAGELCDPVEADAYEQGGVWVSNYVLPSYFDDNPERGARRFDYLGRLSRPFSMTKGGYVIQRKAGKVKEVFAKDFPTWKRAGKRHAAARTRRRGVRDGLLTRLLG